MGGEKGCRVEKAPSQEAQSQAEGPATSRSGKEKGGQRADSARPRKSGYEYKDLQAAAVI